MKSLTVNICIVLLICLTCSMAQSASLSVNQTVDVDGSIKLLNFGNALIFADGTSVTSAWVNDGTAVWGQITGILANQTDLQNQLNLKEDKSNKAVANGYAPLGSNGVLPYAYLPTFSTHASVNLPYDVNLDLTWQKNSTSWVELTSYGINFNNDIPNATLELTFTDNIGFYADNSQGTYCNLGFFLDSAPTPFCYSTFSGVYGYVTFDQKTIRCLRNNMSTGSHFVTVKHRSDNCVYGSSPKGEYSTSRFLDVRLRYD